MPTTALPLSSALLAQALNPNEPRNAWAPVVLLLLIGIGFAVGNVILSSVIGPSRTGPGKETTYESGMVPVGDTRKRFNVRFYIVAMIFLVFDVDIIFMYPWATIFTRYMNTELGAMLLVEMLIFVSLLVVAYLSAGGKGVFRWD